MGWYPTYPHYAKFPAPLEMGNKGVFLSSDPMFGGWIKRGSALGRGTPQKKLHSMGTPSERKAPHFTKLLVDSARARGFVNGVSIKKAPHMEQAQ